MFGSRRGSTPVGRSYGGWPVLGGFTGWDASGAIEVRHGHARATRHSALLVPGKDWLALPKLWPDDILGGHGSRPCVRGVAGAPVWRDVILYGSCGGGPWDSSVGNRQSGPEEAAAWGLVGVGGDGWHVCRLGL